MGTSQSGVTTYPVTILVTIPEDVNVKLGMNASATIVTGSSENALIIPMSALQEMMGESFVMVTSGETVEQRTVTTGLSDGNFVEILSGLEEGETITYTETTDSDSSNTFMMGGMGGFQQGGGGGFPSSGEMPSGGPPSMQQRGE